MSIPEDKLLMVFTDLDGSLLDHHSYSYRDALPQLHRLEHLGIPVIPATSKTRAEIEYLRAELGNRHPFIVENGAAIYIPVGYFNEQPGGTIEREAYWVREMSAPRTRWLDLLAELSDDFPEEFDYFFRAGTQGIVRMTGLPEAQAVQANQRGYSEPVLWLGDDAGKTEFIARLRAGGATILQGGRFLAVSGDCDKGRALAWVRQVVQREQPGCSSHDLAVGDSANDCAMLEAAEVAVLVRSPVHDFPILSRSDGVLYSTAYGPAGWAEGVAHWLHHYHL
jgi:mannosyl-3-phosphoglycerate phosphatase family protein